MIALRLTALCLFLCLTAAAADTTPPQGTLQGLHSIVALLPKGEMNKPYRAVTLVAGGTPPFTVQIVGALPPGMSISSAGALYGTPRDQGIFRFKLDMTDSAGGSVEVSYALQILR